MESTDGSPHSIHLRQVLLSASTIVFVALFFALVSGCSVYSSYGRKTFEERQRGNLVSTNIGQGVPAVTAQEGAGAGSTSTCWTQPSKDPLWEAPQSHQSYSVVSLDEETIEVCLVEE